MNPILRLRVIARLLLVVMHVVLLTLIGTGMPSAAVEGRALASRPHLPAPGIVAGDRITTTAAPVQESSASRGASLPACDAPHADPLPELRCVADQARPPATGPAAWAAGSPPPRLIAVSGSRPVADGADVRMRCHRATVLHL